MELLGLNKEQIEVIQDCLIQKTIEKNNALNYWKNRKIEKSFSKGQQDLILLEINQSLDLLNEVVQKCRIQKAINE